MRAFRSEYRFAMARHTTQCHRGMFPARSREACSMDITTTATSTPHIIASFAHQAPELRAIRADICTVDAEGCVSPANSFGWMDGGVDAAYVRRFPGHRSEGDGRHRQTPPTPPPPPPLSLSGGTPGRGVRLSAADRMRPGAVARLRADDARARPHPRLDRRVLVDAGGGDGRYSRWAILSCPAGHGDADGTRAASGGRRIHARRDSGRHGAARAPPDPQHALRATGGGITDDPRPPGSGKPSRGSSTPMPPRPCAVCGRSDGEMCADCANHWSIK